MTWSFCSQGDEQVLALLEEKGHPKSGQLLRLEGGEALEAVGESPPLEMLKRSVDVALGAMG